MRSLVIEDEPGIAKFVRQGLTEAGHAVDLTWSWCGRMDPSCCYWLETM